MGMQLFAVELTEVRTSVEGPKFKLGQVYESEDGDRYKYVKAVGGAKSANTLYVINGQTGDLNEATTGVIVASGKTFPVGTPLATIAQNGFGWVQTAGSMTLTTAGSVAANATIYTSGTGGAVDDASASQALIDGLSAYTAITGATTGTFFSPFDMVARQ
jgi:hypothetical protein